MAKQTRKTLQERIGDQLQNHFCNRVADVHFSVNYSQIESQGEVPAVNDFGPMRVEVKATPWFSEYWFYILIKFHAEKNKAIKPYASISFFQKTDDELKQLFRAEWDNYPKVEGYNHPQPHWHFTAHLSDKTSFSDLEDAEEEGEYNQLLGNSKTINLDRMHFAMSGNWLSDGNMLNKSDETTLVDWMKQLFLHVREELMYKDHQ